MKELQNLSNMQSKLTLNILLLKECLENLTEEEKNKKIPAIDMLKATIKLLEDINES